MAGLSPERSGGFEGSARIAEMNSRPKAIGLDTAGLLTGRQRIEPGKVAE